jgi:nucleotide-binding universal stress UspA family protein
MFDNELENRNKDALKWAEEAQSEGVSITTSVDIKQGEPVVQSILKLAKKHPGLIAMVSKSGPTKTALLGSTTRNLVRDSPFPVWVLQPRLKTEVLIEKKSA